MRVLLINPEYPETYWSLSHLMPFVGRRWIMPPLGLLTVAALLPRTWELRLIDAAVEPLSDDDLRWADVVMLTGMIVQRSSLLAILDRCRRLGVRSVVGGPYVTAMPDEFDRADHLVLGEAEDVVGELARDLAAGRARRVYREGEKPDLRRSPTPRFDLIDADAYHYLAVQFSRGCPFLCEFCDIISLYGRQPRTKPPEQTLAELEAIRETGFEGSVFFVDDNFIGNRRRVKELLPELQSWRERTSARLWFFTEASINLADHPALVRGMTDAGFTGVFIGLETPSDASLRETGKVQNLKRDTVEHVRQLREHGLDVWGGFILGFDHDGPECFDAMIDFVQSAGVPCAMVGLLTALPQTALHTRLLSEGRLRPRSETGDMFARSNVVMRLPEETMLQGYIRVLGTLYDPTVYFARCREHLEHWQAPRALGAGFSLKALRVFWRSIRLQGVKGRYRRVYWRYLAWVLRRHPAKLGIAIAQACAGHHFITYTRETAIPSLRRSLLEVSLLSHVSSDPPKFRDPHASVDDRVEDLLDRLNLDEKLAQRSPRSGASRGAPGSGDLLYVAGGEAPDRTMAAALQPIPSPQLARVPATGTGSN